MGDSYNSQKNFDDPDILDEINFNEIWLSIKRRKKLIYLTVALSFTLSLVVSIKKRIYEPVYMGSFKLLIKDPLQSSKKNNFSNKLLESLNENKANYDIPTLKAYLKSPKFIKKTAEKFNFSPSSLSGKIKIKQPRIQGIKASGILAVSLEANNFELGEKMLKNLSELYINEAYNQKKNVLDNGLKFLDSQAPIIIAENLKARSELAKFQQKYSIIDPVLTSKDLKEQELEIDKLIINYKAEDKRLKNILIEVKKGNLLTKDNFFSEASKIAYASKDSGVINEYIRATQELAKARIKFTPKSKFVQSIEQKIQKLKPDYIKAQSNAIESAINLNSEELAIMNKKKKDLISDYFIQPELNKEFTNLKINLDVSEQKLIDYYSARETFQLEIAQTSLPWKLIQEPYVGPDPIKPNIPRNLIISLFAGTFLGSLLSLIRDKFDNTFKNSNQVIDETGLTLLGEVPFIKRFENIRGKDLFLIEKDLIDTKSNTYEETEFERFFYQEAMRNIYTSIRFLNVDNKIKTFALTSSIPAEGKSIINILLANTLSELGLKVLLIDADLRKPQIHKRLNLNNFKGFSNLITSKSISIDELVQNVKGNKNFDVITSGIIPPNPTLILSSKKIKLINQKLFNEKAYDFIIYDTPPIQGLSDALLLGENLDGFILLTSLNNVKKPILKKVISTLQSRKINLLGIITNSIKEIEYKKLKKENESDLYLYENYLDTETNKINSELKNKNSNFLKISNYLSNAKDKIIKWIDS